MCTYIHTYITLRLVAKGLVRYSVICSTRIHTPHTQIHTYIYTYIYSTLRALAKGFVRYSVICSTRIHPIVRTDKARIRGFGSEASCGEMCVCVYHMCVCVCTSHSTHRQSTDQRIWVRNILRGYVCVYIHVCI